MADRGYRSIEVYIANDTRGNLTVQGVLAGSGCTWIQGETPHQGDSLQQYNSATWGVSTNDVNGAASFQIVLTGQGSYPIEVAAMNDESGASSASVNPNDVVKGLVTQVATGEMNHSAFQVALVPL